ncbi:MAG: hypothetical protein OEW99_03140 [Gammaproteobacteria bacterium]|nr:hypothetical protein [Gammaproteobacteria bacterium]MDH5660477.1 hypothetical protein [Gammaproteobacteria bacterium]
MKKDKTPQQPHEMYEGESKGVYTVNAEGKYELSRTTGWEPETIALSQALEEIDRLTQQALIKVQQGLGSTLEYYMYAQRMDLAMLAVAVGKYQWQVKRHFKPANFEKLSQQQIEEYAAVLGIDAITLKTIPND